MMNELVNTIMTSNPITVSPQATLEDVKTIFLNSRIHHLPVTVEGRLVGLVTTYDLWRQDQNFADYSKITVGEIMTTRLAKITPEDKVGTAAELFLDKRLHALPVVTEGDRLVGIVTSFDVLRYNFRREYPKPILFADVYYQRSHAAH